MWPVGPKLGGVALGVAVTSMGCEVFQILVSPHITVSTPTLPSPFPPCLPDVFAWHHGVAPGSGLILGSGRIFLGFSQMVLQSLYPTVLILKFCGGLNQKCFSLVEQFSEVLSSIAFLLLSVVGSRLELCQGLPKFLVFFLCFQLPLHLVVGILFLGFPAQVS